MGRGGIEDGAGQRVLSEHNACPVASPVASPGRAIAGCHARSDDRVRLTGSELARKRREDEAAGVAPDRAIIVMNSGNDTSEDQSRYREAGADGSVGKGCVRDLTAKCAAIRRRVQAWAAL